MKTTLENILELLDHQDVFLSSEDNQSCIHLVHGSHRCFMKVKDVGEEEMKMSDEIISYYT